MFNSSLGVFYLAVKSDNSIWICSTTSSLEYDLDDDLKLWNDEYSFLKARDNYLGFKEFSHNLFFLTGDLL